MDGAQHALVGQPAQRRLFQRADVPHQAILFAQGRDIDVAGAVVSRHARLLDRIVARSLFGRVPGC
ncbi:hypothetical protein [Limobrevibacterium gyesilva]|uniref:Uncharacterized protein n=1 Tax=Limobrevibacterium gyesilva TaxID=2991712 RepID=A0AA42CFR4_9PROT|nr:hypothetical protein [Limobrevibacterium gyesilva]MCW3476944.1 hypothetical protein [Limobrevibacterium gyesilva]